MKIKQVIVVRTDLKNKDGHKLRRGKIPAQVAHASMKVFFDRGHTVTNTKQIKHERGIAVATEYELVIPITKEMYEWYRGIFTKICLRVDSEGELLAVYVKAQEAGLPCALIKDAGLTEFAESTYTCVAIGPASEENIDAITGNLSLL